MIHKIGVDILHVPRLQRILEQRYGAALPRRILTYAELSEYKQTSTDKQLSFLATRWTLKEAAWKASQPYPSSWKDCAVHHDRHGAPTLQVNDTIPLEFQCSVSHDGEYCIAYVATTPKDMTRVLKDKRGTGEMILEHERDVPRQRDKADEWINQW